MRVLSPLSGSGAFPVWLAAGLEGRPLSPLEGQPARWRLHEDPA